MVHQKMEVVQPFRVQNRQAHLLFQLLTQQSLSVLMENNPNFTWLRVDIESKTWADKACQNIGPRLPFKSKGGLLMSQNVPDFRCFLLVEDDQTIAFATKTLLKMKLPGIEIDCAPTGKMAEEYIRTKYYDTILLDLGLPDMHGSQLVRFVKTNEESRCGDSRIVVLSAHQMAEQFDHDQFKHVAHFISKPLTSQWIDTLFDDATLRRASL